MSREASFTKRARQSPATKTTRGTGRVSPAVSRGLTFWLFLPAVLIVVGTTCVYWLGWTTLSVASLILIPSYYFLAMCVHDAIHRAAHSNSNLNRAVGWIGSAMMAMPFPTIRRAHLHHHSSLGHDHDDEGFIYRSALTLPIRLLVVNWRFYGVLSPSPKREQVQAAVLISCLIALFIWKPLPLFWGWVFPMQLGVALFALMTVYLPHGPFAKWVTKHIPAMTGFHDDHHAMPQLPWYQYFSLRRANRPK